MGELYIENVLRQVAARVEGALAGVRVATLEAVPEGIADTPMVIVYWEMGAPTGEGAEATHQSTFGKGVQQVELVVHLHLYARQRAIIGEDMYAQVRLADQMINMLQAEQQPYFGEAGLKAFTWRVERATLTAGGENPVLFAGNDFVLTFRLF